ncbi:hypothetical protein HXX02_06865 [Microbulbifer elongatus]|uniref:Uncharacterized protein n=1 Tax=Microbulbifer elongatus TaxID=86173 RepID=A0ABT1NZB1_9GAMM|nr:hypothetical protein [Microbulbifer elongatus]MCQ3829161.1 hypothetical protein [Microbulbifer elongatus]
MDIKPVIVNGLVGGAAAWVMAAFISWLHNRYTKDIPEEKKPLTYDLEQYRELHVYAEFETVLATCLSAVKTIKKAKVKNIDRINRVMTAKVGITFRSFGENIQIALKEVAHKSVTISIESKPRIWGTTADYGKNYENAEIISDYVKASLPTEGQ